MAIGWIRAYREEESTLRAEGGFISRGDRARFRAAFCTELRSIGDNEDEVLAEPAWGDEVELPDGLSSGEWTRAIFGGAEGFIASAHLVEIGYVGELEGASLKDLKTKKTKSKLIWGDLVQILRKGEKYHEVRVRGRQGLLAAGDVGSESLLEVYFVDVGQGDGVLVRTPDGRHLLIDGGLERAKQQTGKNAADFVDWKFFFDYGDHRVRLAGLMASHSDNDHYGGLHDLVRDRTVADRELDCLGVDVGTLHHPGLSRWAAGEDHKQGLGTWEDDCFTLLLDDRESVERGLSGENDDAKLSGPWKWFLRDVLENSSETKVERVMIDREELRERGRLAKLWPSEGGCHIRVLGPVSERIDDRPALPDFGKKSYNTNGHSICLRLDYGKARILLTGDLNTASMNWLEECYGDRIGAWECDVAKACHHGSHDISYRFLERIHAAATVISSGDAEGHAHPRPEIVGASAMSGYKHVDRENDRLLTPLVYMTEIERSVTLGALNRIDIRDLPVDGQKVDAAVLGRHVDELNDKALLTPEDRKKHEKIEGRKEAGKFLREAAKREKERLAPMEGHMRKGWIGVDFNLTVARGPMGAANVRRRAWRSRIMEKNHYGLVNVRTDGKTVLCATLDETEKKWVTHTFPARFPEAEED